MSRTFISPALRQTVSERAEHRCSYCQTAENITGSLFTVDHIVPESLGGRTTLDNLYWALSRWDDKSLARMMINGCRHRGADRAVGLRNRRAEPGSDPLAGAGGQRMLTLNHWLPTKKRLGHTVEAFFT